MSSAMFGDPESAGVRLTKKKVEPHRRAQTSMWDGQRRTLAEALELTAQSLIAYAQTHRHWAVAYSGGKDSSATVAAVAHLIRARQVPAPETLTVLYADTRQELSPLYLGAMEVLQALHTLGLPTHLHTQVVLPPLDDRFFVYMLGRGVPPPKNRFRWCTSQLKIEPMNAALEGLRAQAGEKLLMLTGVRIGESAVRDERIALSCGRDGAECGQGWYQESVPDAVADTLAPLLHWRVCHIWDWLWLHQSDHGLPTALVAETYGGNEAEEINARTGCIGCPLATKDLALDTILQLPQWEHLKPLKKLRPLYTELWKFKHRKQKAGERNRDGKLSANPNRKGPLTLEARAWALDEVLNVQATINIASAQLGRPLIDLINAEEEARIRELIALRTYPDKWSDADPDATELIPQVIDEGIRQELLLTLEEPSA